MYHIRWTADGEAGARLLARLVSFVIDQDYR